MITLPALPTLPNTNPSQTTNIQQLTDAEVPLLLQRENTNDFVKKIVLGYLVNRTIRANEAQHITTGVEIVDMQSSQSFVTHNIDTPQFAASINKLPVVVLLLEDLRSGRLKFDQKLTWTASDVREGMGTYDQPGAPTSATVKQLMTDLLSRSGNTAVRALVNQGLGGAQPVNDRWAKIPQLAHTRLQILEGNKFYLGNSAPHDAFWSMRQLLRTQDVYGKAVKSDLQTNIYGDFGVRSQLAGNDHIVLVNKVGILDDPEGNNKHDVGIIYNTKTQKAFGYAFFTTAPGTSVQAKAQGEQSLKDMGRYLLNFSGDKPKQTDAQSMPNALQPPARELLKRLPVEIKVLY